MRLLKPTAATVHVLRTHPHLVPRQRTHRGPSKVGRAGWERTFPFGFEKLQFLARGPLPLEPKGFNMRNLRYRIYVASNLPRPKPLNYSSTITTTTTTGLGGDISHLAVIPRSPILRAVALAVKP